jgi:uncharacterized protein YndB with AHSA1/START domain
VSDEPSPTGDRARVSVHVAVPIEVAFRIFTEEIDRWWRRGVRYRAAGRERGIIHLEPGVGGRLFESFESDGETRIIETGQVTRWEPPTRLVFAWRGVNFAPSEKTEVDVVFARDGSGTLVTVTHSGFASLRPDHPARHGLPVEPFVRMMGMWWGDLMTALREYARRSADT